MHKQMRVSVVHGLMHTLLQGAFRDLPYGPGYISRESQGGGAHPDRPGSKDLVHRHRLERGCNSAEIDRILTYCRNQQQACASLTFLELGEPSVKVGSVV